MNKGIVRKMDHLGRITIPIEFRRAAGIDAMTPLDLFVEGNVIRLNKGKGRRLDELGRYTIPMEIRRSNGWGEGQALDVYVEFGEIRIGKIGCDWCDNTDDLIEVDDHRLCRKHVHKIIDALAEE